MKLEDFIIFNKVIREAFVLACECHSGQKRKLTGEPYMVHPFAVAMTLCQLDVEEHVIAASLLHDTLEDTSLSYDRLKSLCGTRVADYVLWVTEEDKSLSWKPRKIEALKKYARAPRGALLIALGDKLDNMQSMLTANREQGDDLYANFKGNKEEQHWYYSEFYKIAQEKSWDKPVKKLLELYENLLNSLFQRSSSLS